jgi:putative IMPACT (imprinted ancient) family translation regulator
VSPLPNTIEAPSTYKFEILGSRFIALALPFPSFSNLKDDLASIKTTYPKATHYCYACIDGVNERCSDDGEPARSVGLPLLSLLKKQNLDKILLVVVRYFGGTKLGLGRLARTYLDVAKEALLEANKGELVKGLTIEIKVSYHDYEIIRAKAQKEGVEAKVLSFDKEVDLLLLGDDKIVTALESSFQEAKEIKREECSIFRRIKKDDTSI